MEARLRRALSRGELVLYYQPQVDMRTGALVGCEALVRWNSPERGLILPARFIPLAEETGLPAERLTLELTESMIMHQGGQAVALLQGLKALGLRLSVDDFGTGYSSLAYLKRFPIDELKIDQGFVREIPQDSNDMEIAAAIIGMALNLRLQVVAEGVETEAQRNFLTRQDCHAFQGYLFSRPLPAEEFARLLRGADD